jgi:hypothetical protein
VTQLNVLALSLDRLVESIDGQLELGLGRVEPPREVEKEDALQDPELDLRPRIKLGQVLR